MSAPAPPSPSELSADVPLSARRLIAYALPALPLAALTLPLYVVVPTFYVETVGLSLAAVGQALFLVRLVDAISDPVVGLLADRFRPRLGRRRVWFAAAALPTAIAAAMMLTPPDGATATYLLLWGIVLSCAWTAASIPYTAWGAELARDYHGRTRIAAAREGTVVIGVVVAIALPVAVTSGGIADQAGGLAALALFVLVALPLSAALAVWLVPEPHDTSRTRLALWASLGHIVRNRPFVRLIAAFLLNGFANGLPATLFLFFVASVLEAPAYAGVLLLVYFVAGVAGIPLWLRLSRRFGKHRTWCGAMIFACAIFAFVPFLGPGDLWLFVGVCVLTGAAVGADLVLPPAIQADVIDVDTANSGDERSGLYFALWGLATKLALALAVGVAFPILEVVGFRADDPADRSGLLELALLYAAVPVVLKLAAIALMWNFPVDEASAQATAARIRANEAG
jgi:Na+/melibiose symporter-like transporter